MMGVFNLMALGALCLAGVSSVAIAADRTNQVPVARSAGDVLQAYLKLRDDQAGTWARIQMETPGLVLGDRVAVCALANRDGYLSVWSRVGTSTPPVRVFPNDFTPEDSKRRGRFIGAGQEMCLGEGSEGYGFEVVEPLGLSEVYFFWSPDLAGQFGPEDIPAIPDYGASSRASNVPYSAVALSYRVIEP